MTTPHKASQASTTNADCSSERLVLLDREFLLQQVHIFRLVSRMKLLAVCVFWLTDMELGRAQVQLVGKYMVKPEIM